MSAGRNIQWLLGLGIQHFQRLLDWAFNDYWTRYSTSISLSIHQLLAKVFSDYSPGIPMFMHLGIQSQLSRIIKVFWTGYSTSTGLYKQYLLTWTFESFNKGKLLIFFFSIWSSNLCCDLSCVAVNKNSKRGEKRTKNSRRNHYTRICHGRQKSQWQNGVDVLHLWKRQTTNSLQHNSTDDYCFATETVMKNKQKTEKRVY